MPKRTVVILAVIWMIVLTAGVSAAVTLALCGQTGGASTIAGTRTEQNDRFSRLNELYDMIKSEYYAEIDDDQLVLGAIDGMMAALNDPYSYYCTPDEMDEEQNHQSGAYEGIGVQLLAGENDQLIVTRCFADSPARRAGIRAGDVVIGAAGRELTGSSQQKLETAVELIQGEQGSSVEIRVLRDGEEMIFIAERDRVVMNRVESCLLDERIGYIAIYEFMGDAVDGFHSALESIKKQDAQALIVDVRSNPGGLLTDVVNIADELLDQGLIVYIEDKNGRRESFYSERGAADMPLVVLVNGMSASASEILAGTVQDSGAGTIIGEKTFGKGIVQTIIPLGEDGVHLTTARYFTPSGRSIHSVGIEPDVTVTPEEGDEINGEHPDPARDAQLRAAVNYLNAILD